MIRSYSNEKIKEFLKLKNNKKYRKKEKIFAIEGVRLVFEALKQNAKLKTIFITKKCEEKIKRTKYDLIKFSYEKKLNIIRIDSVVAEKISSVETNQGIFAIVENSPILKKEKIKRNDNVLALFEVKDPGNLGTLFRSAYSFGFFKVLLFNCCDIYNEKVIRSSMGSVFGLSFLECENLNSFIEILKCQQIDSYAATLSKNSKNADFLRNKNGILVLGNEANGLPSFVVSNCDYKVKIKINKKFESLNVSCAGSILMYEMNI